MSYRDFGQTLAAKRKQHKLTQPQLAELMCQRGLDVNPPSISKWEKNVSTPNVHQFFALCEILDITDINEAFGVSVDHNLYAQLNADGQKKATEYMLLLIKSGMYEREKAVIITPPRFRKVFNQPAAAGTGYFLEDDDSFEEIEVGDNVSDKADFGIRVSGDSMEPMYINGQIVWVQQQESLEEGEIGIFCLDGNAYIKKYHISETGVELISLNKKYAPIKVSDTSALRTFGKVVG